jgi:putative transposase
MQKRAVESSYTDHKLLTTTSAPAHKNPVPRVMKSSAKYIAERLQAIIFEVVTENRWQLIPIEIMPDQVHLLLNVKPSDSAADVARRIKGRSAIALRSEFPQLLKLPCMWTPSYFLGSVGNVSTEIVKKYIEQQTGK